MKLRDIFEVWSGDTIMAFPTAKRNHDVQGDRLKKRSSYYDSKTGAKTSKHPDNKIVVVDKDGKSHGSFSSRREAEKAIPRLEMKLGKRGLAIR